MRRDAKLFLLAWFTLAFLLEFGGAGFYAVHAGWLGIGGVVGGPIRVVFVDDVDQYGKPDFEPFRKAMDSTLVTHYLRQHCIKDEKGEPEWRRYDKDANIENEADWVKRLFSARKSAGIVIESKGGQKYSGEPPGDLNATLSLLKRWAGE